MSAHHASSLAARLRFRARTALLLSIYAGFILAFFSISTNQEYYTFPAWFALLMLITGSLAKIEETPEEVYANSYRGAPRTNSRSRWLLGAHAAFAIVGLVVALALGYGLWTSRHLPFVPDIGTVLAHRGVGDYALATSEFFDLTGPSFAALRLPAVIAAVTLLFGPLAAWILRRRGHGLEATASVAFTAAMFLIAAHMALVRFQPMLSSRSIAETIDRFTAGPAEHNDQLILYGDQAYGSSVIFYTHRQALLVDGRSSSMIWGSYYPDAPHIFLEDSDLLSMWGTGPRKFLFVPGDFHHHVEQILNGKLYKIQELADKTLYTDRPVPR